MPQLAPHTAAVPVERHPEDPRGRARARRSDQLAARRRADRPDRPARPGRRRTRRGSPGGRATRRTPGSPSSGTRCRTGCARASGPMSARSGCGRRSAARRRSTRPSGSCSSRVTRCSSRIPAIRRSRWAPAITPPSRCRTRCASRRDSSRSSTCSSRSSRRGPRAILVNSPSNPLGTVVDEELARGILELARPARPLGHLRRGVRAAHLGSSAREPHPRSTRRSACSGCSPSRRPMR